MTWTPSLPTDNTKLRISPGQIRANWNAIEVGAVPYDTLQLQEQAVAPTRQNNTGWLYGKEVASQTELFYEDDRNASLNTQLTNNGGIGQTTQLIYGSAIITAGTYQNTQNAFCSAWAIVAANGTLTSGFGLTSALVGGQDSIYQLTFSVNAASANFAVGATALHTAGNPRIAHYNTPLVTGFKIEIVNQTGSQISGGAPFSVWVFGAR